MKISKLKKIIYGIGISLFFSQGFLNSACSDWTDIEAKDYFVVIPSAATETEKYAAEQLIKYVKAVTGTQISYRSDGAYSGGKVISVGRTEFMDTADISADETELGSDGFIEKIKIRLYLFAAVKTAARCTAFTIFLNISSA